MSFEPEFSVYMEFIAAGKTPRKKRAEPIRWTTEMHVDFLNAIVQCIKNSERITAANVRPYMENKYSRTFVQSHLQKWKKKGGILTNIDKDIYDSYRQKIDEVESSRESSRSSSPVIFETEFNLSADWSTDCLVSLTTENSFRPIK